MRTPIGFAIAKNLTRFFMRSSLKMRGSYRLSLDCLTKPERSCKGLTDTSQSRLSPLALHHAGGVGNAPVISAEAPKEKALNGCSVVKRFKKMGLRHFPKPTKHPLRASNIRASHR